MSHTPLFEVSDLRVSFGRGAAAREAVRGLSLSLAAGEVLGIVGESGSGKSLAMLSALGLNPEGSEVRGSVRFQGREIAELPRAALQKIRGAQIGMVFQDPLSSLNPVMRVGAQIMEALYLHNPRLTRREAEERATELFERVAIAQARDRLRAFPHEFSGGMRQRVMIAMAIANTPALLIADEPTTALDVTVQAQIMEMLSDLQKRLNLGLVLITHDLGVLAGYADRVAVVYAGQVVEQAPVHALFARPAHPYTRGLMAASADLSQPGEALYSIPGTPPPAGPLPPGCPFAPRCDRAGAICRETPPPLRRAPDGAAEARCHFAWQDGECR
ncbi:ABC transporter ATP-binding protein [Falsigemmobacter faecalis]|uniref:ABC transporter ATP-binding protein n=1 Tax=Falsigemmobacter faecalis TaxID=2488730 RepID=A0A3P3DPK5_9RHOB|nr:ABC transporter ATP-binding protein [Falsigemmobacter faecalis]RRH76125.1 ABC transporter ATP-binding protein [Falsigemmobacter faecalis]